MKTKETNTEVKQGAGTYDFSSMLITSEEGEDTSKKPSFEGFEDEEEEEEATPKEGSEDTKEEVEVEETKDKKSLATEEEEEEEVKKTKEPGEVSHPSKMAKKYIEQGIWEDYIIDYKGEETPISEIEDLDEDTFFEIIKAQKEENEKDISSNYINKSELDEISLEVVEISKNGGDISNVLKIKEQFINPLESYDLNEEDHQEELVRQMYSMENKALSPKQIDRLIEADKVDLELENKATNFANKLKDSFKETLRQQKQAAYDNKQKQEDDTKKLKKDLREEFKNLGYDKAAFTSPLIDKATSKEGFDQEIKSLREDPKMLAEFLIWKSNPEEYRKNIASKEIKKEQVGTARKLNLLRKESGSSSKSSSKKEPAKEDKTEEEFFKRLEK
jgi:hypothetical protein